MSLSEDEMGVKLIIIIITGYTELPTRNDQPAFDLSIYI